MSDNIVQPSRSRHSSHAIESEPAQSPRQLRTVQDVIST